MNNHNCTLVIAGPGAGKTTRMVSEILCVLSTLDQYRYMAVITYTNAATDKIRGLLGKYIKIPENIFIGTIHAFINRFILFPYGRIFGVLPSDYFLVEGIDFSFLNSRSFQGNKDRIVTEKNIEKDFSGKGIVTYSQIEVRARDLLESNKVVRVALANRLQYLFIDEIQDATSTQYRIFEYIRKIGKTSIFFIGDPEQYIYGFTYHDKHMQAPLYKDIPIKRIENTKGVKKVISRNETNNRSTSKIVDFLNKFRKPELSQNLEKKYEDEPSVIFIRKTKIEEVVADFETACAQFIPHHIRIRPGYDKFFLAHNNNTFNSVFDSFQMRRASNELQLNSCLVTQCVEYICAVSGRSKAEVLDEMKLSLIELRKIAFWVLQKIKNDSEVSEEELIQFIKSIFSISLKRENQKTHELFRRLKMGFQYIGNSRNMTTSIHKAKGLESSAVLALAEKRVRLEKWIETDYVRRESDKQDECRLGFVAFSRAKDFLSIACLEPVSQSILDKLSGLGVQLL